MELTNRQHELVRHMLFTCCSHVVHMLTTEGTPSVLYGWIKWRKQANSERTNFNGLETLSSELGHL